MQIVSAKKAIGAIPDGSRVVLPQGAIEPSTLYEAFAADHQRFRTLALYSGLQFGTYPFLAAGLGTHFTYTTWQAAHRLRDLMGAGAIGFVPLRFSQICPTFSRAGPLPADVVIIQTTPPERGRVSLGIAVSIYPELIESTRLVIAEINPAMPRIEGAAVIAADAIDFGVEAQCPLGTYASRPRTARDEKIADHVQALVPRGAWVQLGVGAIPDAVLARLADVPDANLHSGMLTDGLMQYLDRVRHTPRVIAGEVAGSAALYDAVGASPAVELHPTRVTHSRFLARLPRFVAINSAIEVDLSGQINAEAIDGVQVSGVGGSLDFTEAAAYSPGGISITTLPSTTPDGKRSRIVATLAQGTPVTIPRVAADAVVTEFGVAHLRGRDLHARTEALIAVAHPEFRDGLAREAAANPPDRSS
jgi:4-hydroxybutyrate CoA-transferase